MKYNQIFKMWHFWVLLAIMVLPKLGEFYYRPFSSAGEIAGMVVGLALIYSFFIFLSRRKKKKKELSLKKELSP